MEALLDRYPNRGDEVHSFKDPIHRLCKLVDIELVHVDTLIQLPLELIREIPYHCVVSFTLDAVGVCMRIIWCRNIIVCTSGKVWHIDGCSEGYFREPSPKQRLPGE